MSEWARIWLVIGLALAIVIGSAVFAAKCARAQWVLIHEYYHMCWFQDQSTDYVRLFAESSFGTLEVTMIDAIEQPLPSNVCDLRYFCARAMLFEHNYEMYLVGYNEGGASEPSNRILIVNEPEEEEP